MSKENNKATSSQTDVICNPKELELILAKIQHQDSLGLSSWYEVVYFDGK